MATEDATEFYIKVQVEPEHVDEFRRLIAEGDDDSLLLDFEKVIGRRIAGLPRLKEGIMGAECYDHGVGIAEVYEAGQSNSNISMVRNGD